MPRQRSTRQAIIARRALGGTLIAGVLLVGATPAAAQRTDDSFQWSGGVSAGNTVYVKSLNGPIRVERGSGTRVEITAEKRWRRGDPDQVRIELQRVGSNDADVLVCALWGEQASCDEDGYRSGGRERWWGRGESNDVSVTFTVRVPDGVRLDLATTNGELRIEGATADVRARTVNGAINATSAGGPVRAKTVNGSINVRMGQAGREDLEYETVNGSIVVEVPAGLDADVEMSTVNGRVESDFPITVRGRIDPKRIRATIGNGGRRLEASTVNGSITLRRSN